MTRLLAGLALLLAVVSSSASPGLAQRWHGHHEGHHYGWRGPDWWHSGRWHHGWHDGHLGWWWIIGASWYFYPQPVYPYPPEVVVVPVPAPPPQASAAPPPQPRPYCREYQGDAIINGTNQRFYGTACLQPDGSWRIVK